MQNCASKTALLAACLFIGAALLGGCQQNETAAVNEKPVGGGVSAKTDSNGSQNISLTHKNETDAVAESSSDKQSETEETAWNADDPALHYITLGSKSKSASIVKLGKPDDQYTMGSGSEKLSILEFEGFTVGIGPKQTVVFVEVYDTDIATGINGLAVGKAKDAAVQALGKPTTNTSSAVTYQTDSTVLKLDVDPSTGSIVSVKLFYANAAA